MRVLPLILTGFLLAGTVHLRAQIGPASADADPFAGLIEWREVKLGQTLLDPPGAVPPVARTGVFSEAIRNLRVLADGTLVLCTHGDPLSRHGPDPDHPKRVWINATPFVEAHRLHPDPVVIDSAGRAWFDVQHPVDATHWHVHDGHREIRVPARSPTIGRPVEDRFGGIWLPDARGVLRWTGTNTLHAIDLPPGTSTPITWGHAEQPAGIAWFPRWPDWDNGGTKGSILHAQLPSVARTRTDREAYADLLHLLPLPGGEWLASGIDMPFSWQPPHRPLPPEIEQSLEQLAAPTHAERLVARTQLQKTGEQWFDRLALLVDRHDQPEIAHQFQSIATETSTPRLPGDWTNANWNYFQLAVQLRPPPGQTNDQYATVEMPFADAPTRALRASPHLLLRRTGDGPWEPLVFDPPGIPADMRPTRRRPWDPITGTADIHPLRIGGEPAFAWLDPAGRIQIVRGGEKPARLNLPPLPFVAPASAMSERTSMDFPFPALLGLHDGALLFRAHGRILAWPLSDLEKLAWLPFPARDLVSTKDLALRAKKMTNDETGQLTEEMLGWIRKSPDAPVLLCTTIEKQQDGRWTWSGAEIAGRLRGLWNHPDDLEIHAGSSRFRSRDRLPLAFRHADLEIRQTAPKGQGYITSSHYLGRGLICMDAQNWKGAITDHRAAIRHNPLNDTAWNNLAWLLATVPDPDLRDGKLAVKFATTACEQDDFESAYSLDTLAAAYAEAGDFKAAIKWQKKAMKVAGDSGMDLGLYERHLASFREGKALRLPEADEE